MSHADALATFYRHHEALRWLLRVLRSSKVYGIDPEAARAVRCNITATRAMASQALTHLR
jgi:hypothetical protein